MRRLIDRQTTPLQRQRLIRSTGFQPVIFSQPGRLCYVAVRCAVGLLIFCLLPTAFAAPSSQGNAAYALSTRLKQIQSRLPAFKHQLDDLKANGQDISYPLVTDTVLENFTAYALEDLGIRTPSGWGMIAVNGAAASARVMKDAHSGQWAMEIVNHTPRQPNVYGMLECRDVISLQAGKPYTLSVWSKGEKPGVASVTLNASWTERLSIDGTGGVWRRFSKTFTPTPANAAYKPRVVVEDVGSGFIIDDICLVSGTQAEVGKNLLPNPSFEESWNQERVSREIGDMEAMADRLKAQLEQAEAGKITFPIVPRWDGTSRPTIKGPSFMGPVKMGTNGASVRRPIFFVGYGHFDQVRNDVEKFPGYGVNIVQNGELGPSAIYPKEGQTDDAFEALAKFKGKIIFAIASNEPLLTRNEYDRPRTAQIPGPLLSDPIQLSATWRALLPMLRSRFAKSDVSSIVEVTNADGSPQAQVQWQNAQTTDGLVVNLYNTSHDDATVTITPPTAMTDLLSGEKLLPEARIRLRSLDMRLFVADGKR